ncbi:hypothetical protein CEE44_03115 [Candidatus Woesearchaeota archaeon B3_Woes]|nr:MAG: hypothetical protein CEE44_03115 [Candidatus Woesearchaeota archaeon B3_Woes]
MEITKLSTKGQIVIPESMRKGLEVGSAFKVIKKGELIILKEVEGLTKEEMEEMKELDKIWKGIDDGKGVTMNKKEFLKELESW